MIIIIQFLKHNYGKGAKSTRGRIWKVFYTKKYTSKSAAMSAEYILKKDKSGSRIGLEDAHDDIYQRIIKKNKVEAMNSLVDSLRKNSKIFINVLYN